MDEPRPHYGDRRKGKRGYPPNKTPEPWTPTPQQLEGYHYAITGHHSQREAAEKFGISAHTVNDWTHKIDAWLVPQWMDRIREIKSNHCQRLMIIFDESMQQWFKSKEKKVSWKRDKDGKMIVDRVESSHGDSRHLKSAMDALLQIRVIWGMNAPEKVEGETVLRIGGLDRAEAIARRQAELSAAQNVEREHTENRG
jgi:hypothetical protein